MSHTAHHALGFREIRPRPSADELRAYYAQQYFQQARGSYELHYSETELAWIRSRSRVRVDAVVDAWRGLPDPTSPRRLLDVGCGEGFGMQAFRDRGWDVRGLDFSVAGIRAQNPRLEPFLIAGDVQESITAEVAASNRYDCVTLINVLEHVLDPITLMESIHELLLPHGVLVVTVPNDFSLLQALALSEGHVEREYWVAPPDHLQYFDSDALASISDATGWRVIDLLGDFPIEWFLFHPGSNYSRLPAVGKLAHMARCAIEAQALSGKVSDALKFQRGLAAAGMCRNITALLASSRLK